VKNFEETVIEEEKYGYKTYWVGDKKIEAHCNWVG